MGFEPTLERGAGKRTLLGIFAPLIAVGMLFTLGACGSQEKEEPVGIESTSQAICSAADLYQDPGSRPVADRTCAGPWAYRLYPQTCTLTRPRQCRHPCFGDSGAMETISASFTGTGACQYSLEDCEFGHWCYALIGTRPDIPPGYAEEQAIAWININIPSTCGGASAPYDYNALRARVRAAMQRTAFGGCPDYLTSGPPPSRYWEQLDVNYRQFPVWNLGRDATYCGGTETYEGHDTECPVEATWRYSRPGISIAQLGADNPGRVVFVADDVAQWRIGAGEPVCLTRDPMPASTQDEVRRKFDKLKESWDNSDPDALSSGYILMTRDTRLALRVELAKRFKALFELSGGQLTDPQRSFVLQNIIPNYDEQLACDVPQAFTPPASACADVYPSDNRMIDFCTRLTQSYSIDVSTQLFDQCVAVGNKLARLRDGQMNVALAKPTQQSSTSSGGASSRAVDGNANGNWRGSSVTMTNAEPNAWWQVDLQSSTQINTIEIHNRTDCCSDRLRDFYVLVSDNPFTSTDLASTLAQPGVTAYRVTGQAQSPQVVSFGAAGRYIRVQLEAANQQLSLAEVEVWSQRPSPCNSAAYRDAYNRMTFDLLQKDFTRINPINPQNEFLKADLQFALGRIQEWYWRARSNTYPGVNPDPRLWTELTAVLSGFWARLDIKAFIRSDDPTLTTPATLDVFRRGLAVDQAVLDAALDPQLSAPPVTGAPLVQLVSQSFKGINDRLQDAIIFHDVSCRFLSCQNFRSQTSELLDLFSAIPVEADLQSRLSGLTQLAVGTPWRTIFTNLRTWHLSLRDGVLDASGAAYPPNGPAYAPDLLVRPSETQLRPPVSPLSALIKNAQDKSTNYQRYGRFHGDDHNVIAQGMRENQIDWVSQELTTRLNQLDGAITAYRNNREARIRDLLQELQRNRDRENIRTQSRIRLNKYKNLSMDLAQLRQYTALEEQRFSNFGQALNQQREDGDYLIARQAEIVLPISARDARFWDRSNLIESYAYAPGGTVFRLRAKKGDVVNFSITGNWAPTCALRATDYTRPFDQGGLGIDIRGITTGPEGWTVTQQAGRVQEQAYETSQDLDWGKLACSGLAQALPTVMDALSIPGGSAAGSAAEKACQLLDGTKDGHDDRESRSTAAFVGGLRLRDTPFVRAPAGSLLLVQMPRDVLLLDQLANIHVLQRNSSIVVTPDDADLYLVVNDRVCPDARPDALTVSIRHLVTSGQYVKALGKAMGSVYEQLRADTELFADAGRVLPQDLVARRAWAYAEVNRIFRADTDPPIEVTQMPPHLVTLFEAFVNKELARLERIVEMRGIERDMSLLTIEYDALRRDLEMQGTQQFLEQMLTGFSLRSLERDNTLDQTTSVAKFVNRSLFPVMDIRCPLAIANVLGDAQARSRLELLAREDWSADADVYAQDLRNATQSIYNIYRSICPPQPTTLAGPLVALGIPKPGVDTSASGWRQVDAARAQAVWDEVRLFNRFSLTILPEELYTPDGAIREFPLWCNYASPVIRGMALFAVRPGSAQHDFWDTRDIEASLRFSENLEFVTEAGIKSYVMENSTDYTGGIRILSGEYSGLYSPLTLYDRAAARLQAGNGLTPFVNVSINAGQIPGPLLQEFQNLVGEATELVLLMEIERRSTRVQLPPICQ